MVQRRLSKKHYYCCLSSDSTIVAFCVYDWQSAFPRAVDIFANRCGVRRRRDAFITGTIVGIGLDWRRPSYGGARDGGGDEWVDDLRSKVISY